MITANPDLGGIFAVWDTPAIQAATAAKLSALIPCASRAPLLSCGMGADNLPRTWMLLFPFPSNGIKRTGGIESPS